MNLKLFLLSITSYTFISCASVKYFPSKEIVKPIKNPAVVNVIGVYGSFTIKSIEDEGNELIINKKRKPMKIYLKPGTYGFKKTTIFKGLTISKSSSEIIFIEDPPRNSPLLVPAQQK